MVILVVFKVFLVVKNLENLIKIVSDNPHILLLASWYMELSKLLKN